MEVTAPGGTGQRATDSALRPSLPGSSAPLLRLLTEETLRDQRIAVNRGETSLARRGRVVNERRIPRIIRIRFPSEHSHAKIPTESTPLRILPALEKIGDSHNLYAVLPRWTAGAILLPGCDFSPGEFLISPLLKRT